MIGPNEKFTIQKHNQIGEVKKVTKNGENYGFKNRNADTRQAAKTISRGKRHFWQLFDGVAAALFSWEDSKGPKATVFSLIKRLLKKAQWTVGQHDLFILLSEKRPKKKLFMPSCLLPDFKI